MTSRQNRWDTILDFGTIEHVFDIGQAFENCKYYQAESGCIVHVSPGNGHSGHGLYQLSPDVFFTAYGHGNCQDNFSCRVFYGNHWWPERWMEVRPLSGKRVELTNYASEHLYSVCITINKAYDNSSVGKYQASYLHEWNERSGRAGNPRPARNLFVLRCYLFIFYYLHKYLPCLLPSISFHPQTSLFSPVRGF